MEVIAVLHPHLPHPHVHVDVDEHPWEMLPLMLGSLILLATVLMVVVFVVAKVVTGQAY